MKKKISSFGFFEKLIVGLVCVFAFSVLFININEPFWGHHEFNGVFYGQIARNYLQYGLLETKGAQVNNLWPTDPSLWNLHTHHPATYPLLLAAAYSLFGVSESVGRMMSIFATVVGVGALMYLSSKTFGRNALLSVLPIIATPLFLYYGRLPVFEPLLMPLVIVGLFAYIKIDNNKWSRWVLCLSVFGAFLLDWPGFWLGFWIFVVEMFTKRRKAVLMNVSTSLLIALLLIVAHQWLATGHPYRDFLDVGGVRVAGAAQPYTPVGWVKLLLSRAKAFYGLPVLAVAMVGFALTMIKGKSQQKMLLMLSLAIGVSHILVFRNITWYHDYMLYHLIPFFVFAFGGIAVWFEKNKFKNISVISIWLVMTTMTTWTTNKFYVDLSNIKPHQKCVEIGKEVAKNDQPLTFELSEEDTRICPPFTGYYGNKEFKLEVKD